MKVAIAVMLLTLSTLAQAQYSYRLYPWVSTGPDSKQNLNAYLPSGGPRNKVLAFVHGGGWVSGNPWNGHDFSKYYAELGYTTVSIGYRLAPNVTNEEQISDVEKGLDLVRGFFDDPIVLVGHSAGAQIIGGVAKQGGVESFMMLDTGGIDAENGWFYLFVDVNQFQPVDLLEPPWKGTQKQCSILLTAINIHVWDIANQMANGACDVIWFGGDHGEALETAYDPGSDTEQLLRSYLTN